MNFSAAESWHREDNVEEMASVQMGGGLKFQIRKYLFHKQREPLKFIHVCIYWRDVPDYFQIIDLVMMMQPRGRDWDNACKTCSKNT